LDEQHLLNRILSELRGNCNLAQLYLIGDASADVTFDGLSYWDAEGNCLEAATDGGTIDGATVTACSDLAAIPEHAVEVRLVGLSGNLRWVATLNADVVTDLATHPENYPKRIKSPEYNAFGRCANQ
jgi:hypothetical protein